jgi:hypothetical protein
LLLVLSFQNPSDDLLAEEGQFAARGEPEDWQACGDKLLPYGPLRAAKQLGYLPDRHRFA